MPNLPGFRSNRPRMAAKGGFDVVNGVMVEGKGKARSSRNIGTSLSAAGSSMMAGGTSSAAPMSHELADCFKIPAPEPSKAWVTKDKLVLNFTAQFEEEVGESQFETSRLRNVQLFYYLVDDTLEIIEMKQANSGLPQGVLLKRHRVPNGAGAPGSFLGFGDLRVGASVVAYGRAFAITDCNASTRNWLFHQGVTFGSPTALRKDKFATTRPPYDPEGSFHSQRSEIKKYMEATLGNTVNNSTRGGFENFGTQVLRFGAIVKLNADGAPLPTVADAADIAAGRVMHYTLNYFLSRKEVEVLEKHVNNSGRDPWPYLLRAQRLPKEPTVPDASGRFEEVAEDAYYSWQDLFVGAEVTVYNRLLKIVSCDGSTRRFYEAQRRPLAPDVDVPAPQKRFASIVHKDPPPTGYGGDEDSLGSLRNLIPKAPKTDFEKSGGVFNTMVLTLKAKMDPAHARSDDLMRDFVILYYCQDNTVQIREPPVRNSGVVGGNFLSRRKVTDEVTGKLITAQELYLGAQITLSRHKFVVVEVDGCTLNYFEKNRKDFPMSDVDGVMDSLRGQMWSSTSATDAFPQGNGTAAAAYTDGLRALFPDCGEQELLTVTRNLSVNQFVHCLEEGCSVAQAKFIHC